MIDFQLFGRFGTETLHWECVEFWKLLLAKELRLGRSVLNLRINNAAGTFNMKIECVDYNVICSWSRNAENVCVYDWRSEASQVCNEMGHGEGGEREAWKYDSASYLLKTMQRKKKNGKGKGGGLIKILTSMGKNRDWLGLLNIRYTAKSNQTFRSEWECNICCNAGKREKKKRGNEIGKEKQIKNARNALASSLASFFASFLEPEGKEDKG